jgi:hypothetical protein
MYSAPIDAGWSNNLSLGQRWPIVDRHNANDIVGPLDDDRFEATAIAADLGHPLERLRL